MTEGGEDDGKGMVIDIEGVGVVALVVALIVAMGVVVLMEVLGIVVLESIVHRSGGNGGSIVCRSVGDGLCRSG